MKSKKRKISIVTALALIIIAIALTISITMGLALSYFNKTFGNVNQKRILLEYISKADEFVSENYYGKVSDDSLRAAIVKGYLNGIGDAHASFIAGEDYVKIKETLTGQTTDFGIEIAQTLDGESMAVYVHEGSPAGRAGISLGDVIVSINDEDMRDKSADYVVDKLNKTNKAKISITHGMDNEQLNFEITKTTFTYQSVRYHVMDQLPSENNAAEKHKIGYIRITDFYNNTDDQFEEAYKSLLAQNVTEFVFDLRFNRGGDFETMNNILKTLLPKEQYGTFIKKKEEIKLIGTATMPLDKPSVVLINNNTSTESEFFAVALKAFGKSKIVGQSSKGINEITAYFEVGADRSAVRFTIGELVPLNAASWKSTGVLPDREAFNEIGTFVGIVPLNLEEDIQLLAGVDVLKKEQNLPDKTDETTAATASTTAVPETTASE